MRTLHAKVSVFSIRPMDAGCPIPRNRGDCFVGVPSQALDKPTKKLLSFFLFEPLFFGVGLLAVTPLVIVSGVKKTGYP